MFSLGKYEQRLVICSASAGTILTKETSFSLMFDISIYNAVLNLTPKYSNQNIGNYAQVPQGKKIFCSFHKIIVCWMILLCLKIRNSFVPGKVKLTEALDSILQNWGHLFRACYVKHDADIAAYEKFQWFNFCNMWCNVWCMRCK